MPGESPQREEPVGLQSMGLQSQTRLSDSAHTAQRIIITNNKDNNNLSYYYDHHEITVNLLFAQERSPLK